MELRLIFSGIAALLSLSGICYLIAVMWCARKFVRRRVVRPGEFTPPVSILKPLKGADPKMYESFRSHCLQEYPEFEIIFGVNDEADPAVAVVHALQQEFPQVAIRLITCSEVLGSNRKVSNLVHLLREARYEHIVINDSDIRVERDYLQKVMAPFSKAWVGLVSALYRAVPGDTLGSQLESLAINTEFPGGILAAIALEKGMHFALGSTLAVTRESLAAIGGLQVLVNHLADDYELGNRIAKAGYRAKLADTVVETFVPNYTMSQMFRHQLRWARTIRDRRAGQYAGLTIVYALPWAIIALLLSNGGIWAWSLLLLTFLIRMGNGYTLARYVVHDKSVARRLWLLPVRDCVALAVWATSFFGDTIEWRGVRFRLKEGKLYPL